MSIERILGSILSEIGLDRSDFRLSSPEYEARQLRNCLTMAGLDIARRGEWSRLFEKLVIPAGAGEAILPDDFYKIPQRGVVRAIGTPFTPLRPITAPEQWAFLQAHPSQQGYYHLSRGRIYFSPALGPDGAEATYISSHWAYDMKGGKSEIERVDDQVKIPQRLLEKGAIWRWKRQKGLAYEDILSEFEADLILEIAADRGAPPVGEAT